MQNSISVMAALLCLGACTFGNLGKAAESPEIPSALAVAPTQKLVMTLKSKGVQIYRCKKVDGVKKKFEWKLEGPEAQLFDEQGKEVGKHYAGPTWELNSGDKLVGKVKEKATAPKKDAVAWLLLESVESSGKSFGHVKSIQRIETDGGNAPARAKASNVGEKKRVPYSATYRFFAD